MQYITWFPPPLRCRENQEFETDALRALLNCHIMPKVMTLPATHRHIVGTFPLYIYLSANKEAL
jgi:hypothetical protein